MNEEYALEKARQAEERAQEYRATFQDGHPDIAAWERARDHWLKKAVEIAGGLR